MYALYVRCRKGGAGHYSQKDKYKLRLCRSCILSGVLDYENTKNISMNSISISAQYQYK